MLVLPPHRSSPSRPPRRVTAGKTKWSCCTAFFLSFSPFFAVVVVVLNPVSLFPWPLIFFLSHPFILHLVMSLCSYRLFTKRGLTIFFTRGLTQCLHYYYTTALTCISSYVNFLFSVYFGLFCYLLLFLILLLHSHILIYSLNS